MTAVRTDLGVVGPDTYAQVVHFYARHMRKLDAGQAEEWAADFTEDGVFEQNVKPDPWRGRDVIATSMRRGVDRLAARKVVRRHWFGMISATGLADGSLRTEYYALVLETPHGGDSTLYLSTAGTDLLVWGDDRLLVQHRRITHDGTE